MYFGDLDLKFHKCPEARKFTKEEEKLYFPKQGENVLCLLKNGEYAILEFNFYYFSSKKSKDSDEFIRDGNGETIWKEINSDICGTNNENGNDIIGWYRLPD